MYPRYRTSKTGVGSCIVLSGQQAVLLTHYCVGRLKVRVHMKAVLTSLNTDILPISRSCVKQCYISMLISLTTVRQFCVNFLGIFGKGRLN